MLARNSALRPKDKVMKMKRETRYSYQGGRAFLLSVSLVIALFAACSDDNDTTDKPDAGPRADLLSADLAAADVGGDGPSTSDLPRTDGPRPGDLTLSDQAITDGPPLMLLSNENPCITDRGFSSLTTGDPGDMKVVRLTPAAYPFTVTHVRYGLEGNLAPECDNTLAHRVEVFAASGHAPESSPSIAETIDVPAVASAPAERLVVLPLATPLTLQGGEHLFVAVEQAGNATHSMCLYMCLTTVADRNYWSESTVAPYTWEPYSTGNLTIEALGY